MSWVTSRPGGGGGGGGRGGDSDISSSVPPDLDEITDEELLKHLWQQAEDFSDRRRIRARMYKLREKRLREMVQNDEESLGALTMTDEGDSSYHTETHTSHSQSSDRKSSVETKLDYKGDTSLSGSSSRVGQLSMKGVGSRNEEDIIDGKIKEVSKGRGARYQQVINKYDDQNIDSSSTSRSNYSVQSNALTGDSYQSIKHKEVRDSVSPVRGAFDRRLLAEESETTFTSDDEVAIKSENESVSSRNTSRDDRSIKSSSSRKISERKLSKELNLSTSKRTEKSSPTSPSRKVPGDNSPSKTVAKKQTVTQGDKQLSIATKTKSDKRANLNASASRLSSGRKKINEKRTKMGKEINGDYKNLSDYLNENVDSDDEIIKEEEEEAEDETGNAVKMIVQTRKKKDGTQIISRRLARSMKIVEKESDIDEILVGNPDHEVLERNVEEKEEKDGSKIKIITETRRRPDGIEYTTKNVLKTSKIFDYDHPEDIAYSEHDELISSEESTETDENGIVIRTVIETRRKKDGVEYTTKKVYKTSKVDATIAPSDDDEILDRSETEEEQSDGSILKIIIEKRRTKDGHEYTHRQVYRSRKLTLSGIDVLKGMPSMDNDDEVIDRKEKEDLDENKAKIKIVTETRRRKDGSTYSFEYVLRSFKGTEKDIEKISIEAASNSSNINVSDEDKIIKEDVKEELQKDGSIVRTIIERRKAKDGSQYLRHRIMKIPKLPEPELVVGSLDDEVIEEDVKEKVLEDGTHCKAITERRRSSTTGVHYTLRRMSKVFHHQCHLPQTDEIIDENVTEEEAGNGILVKTVIRRYERPDGSVYTTHDIQKSYKSPVAVNVDEYENDELIDRSYDERETFDGYIIKTIIETRCRNDGTHYTIERTEKVSKLGDGVEVSFKGNSINSGSPGDAVVSCEEHEEPSDDGAIVKTILEVRRRQDGTEYTNKITIRSREVLVPEHETSYVIIKADSKDGDGECAFFPSLEDEIVYVRKKKDIDERGNPITILIETRKSKKTGEKYNLTKKIHTTDVVITDKGEKILSKKPQRGDTLPRNRKSMDKIEKKTNRFSPVKKEAPKTTSSIIVNLITKKATVNQATKVSPLKPTTVKKSPKSGYDSEPSISSSLKKPIRRSPSGDNKKQDRLTRKTIQDVKKTDSHITKQRVSQSNSLPVTKTKVISRKPLPKSGKGSDISPEQQSENDSSGKESPKIESKSRSEIYSRKSPVTRVSSSPARGRSPLRSGTSTPREGTPVRQCCKRVEQESPLPKQKAYVPLVRNKPQSEDRPKYNGYLKKEPRKIQPEKFSKFEKSPARDSPARSQKPKSSEKPYPTKVLPEKSNQDSNKFKKTLEKKEKAPPPNNLSFEREPIVSLPQTPLTEEMKAYPASASSPYIEDVSTEPDLPYHTVHRPSLVREPSEYNPDVLNEDNLDTSDTSKVTKASTPKSTFDTKFDKKTSDSSVFSSSEDESRKLPYRRKDSPFKPYITRNKEVLHEERKPAPIIEKTKDYAPKSLLDQIIPSETSEVSLDDDTDKENKIDLKNSFTAKLSMFEKSKSDTKDFKISSCKPEKKQPQTEKLVPVKEPLIVPKYIHPLGSDSESDTDKPKKTTKEDVNLSSTRLVMSAISSDSSHNKRIQERENTSQETEDIVTPLRERSKSPFSKETTPRPRSKEGSPAPFVKEDSPGRFLTGKPIDQGPNTTKIKRLERSNSNKKIIYEDLEVDASNLPSYLKDIEYITDISVLETLLQKAETYEERRIIRGHIRSLKKVDSNLTKTTPSSNYKRFIDPTPSKSSPSSSPSLSRKIASTDTASSIRSAQIRKSYTKGESKSPQVSPTDEVKPFRSSLGKDRRYKKRSSDESESDRRSSVEEVKYERKLSSELIQSSEVKSSLYGKSRDWKYTPTETSFKKSTETYSETKVRKSSPEGRSLSDRTSSPEDSKRDRYRKLSDEVSKGRKISGGDSTRKSSREETARKISREENTKKKSREETIRKTSTEFTRKTSLEETVRKSSRDSSVRKTSRDDTVRKTSRDDGVRKKSHDDTIRKNSLEESTRKTSQDETTKKVMTREEARGKTSRDVLRNNISREYTRKTSREDSYRRSSPEDNERHRLSSPETPKGNRKLSPESKTKRKMSPDNKSKEEYVKESTKDLDSKLSRRQPFEVTTTKRTEADFETSVKSTNIFPKSDVSKQSGVSKKYTRKSSAEIDVKHQSSDKSTLNEPHETKEKPDSKLVSRSPFLTRKQKDTSSTTTSKTKETSESHVYMEPLRHQRTKATEKLKVEQTNVDKIVSPYGVGPTDEYGLPLIGLKALRRRQQQQTIEEPETPKPEKTEEEFVPSDAQGRPLFGLRALRKAPETTTFTTTQVAKESTAVQETLHNAVVSTETSHLQSGVISQPETHTRETSPSLVKSVDMSLRRKSSVTESENETEKTVSLRDIIKLHEAKVVSENTETKESSSTLVKPKKKLRDTFEPTTEQVTESRPHRTWDLEADLSTRSQVMENIIAKHETLTKQEAVKPAKKLNGILKKTSTSSIQTSKIVSSDSEGFESSERMETMEKKLSTERSPSPSKFEDLEEFRRDETKAERKTSYTEIKLSKPSEDGDESKPLRIIKGQKSAEVKISETERRDKTDKREERLEFTKTSSKTTSPKESVSKDTKKIINKKGISEEKSLTSTRDKSPTLTKDLFKIDDRKGNVYTGETKTTRRLSTRKSEEKIVKGTENAIKTKVKEKSPERLRNNKISSPKSGKKEIKSKTLKDSIEKDSIDGESSNETSSDESESSVDLKNKRKSSKTVKPHVDEKNYKKKQKETRKASDLEIRDKYTVPRKKSDSVTKQQKENLNKYTRSRDSSSSPERFTTKRIDKSEKKLRDERSHKTSVSKVFSKPSPKTPTPKEDKHSREKNKTSVDLAKITTKSKVVKELFTEGKRKSFDLKHTRLTSPDRERKFYKKPQDSEAVSTDLHIETFISSKKSMKKESPYEKQTLNNNLKVRPEVKNKDTSIKTVNKFNRHGHETRVSVNISDLNKSMDSKDLSIKSVIVKKNTNRKLSDKLNISDTSDVEVKHSPKKYVQHRKESKKTIKDEDKSKVFSEAEMNDLTLKEKIKSQCRRDHDLNRKSPTNEQPKKQSRSPSLKTKSSSDSEDVKSEGKTTTKTKKVSVGLTSHIRSIPKEKETTREQNLLKSEKLSEEEKRKNLAKNEFTIRKESLKAEKLIIKENKGNVKTEVVAFKDDKRNLIEHVTVKEDKGNLRTEHVTANEDKKKLKPEQVTSLEDKRSLKTGHVGTKEEKINVKTEQETARENKRNLEDKKLKIEKFSDEESIERGTKSKFYIKKDNSKIEEKALETSDLIFDKEKRISIPKDKKRDSNTQEVTVPTRFNDEPKFKVYSDSSESETTVGKVIIKSKQSTDEENARKIESSEVSLIEDKRHTYKKGTDSGLKKEIAKNITEKNTTSDMKERTFLEQKFGEIDSQLEKKTERKEPENKTDVSKIVDKTEPKSKKPIFRPTDSEIEQKMDRKSIDAEVNISKTKIIDNNKDVIDKIDKDDKSPEIRLRNKSEKKAKVNLDKDEEKRIIKSSELDTDNTKILSDKWKERSIKKEEVIKDSNQKIKNKGTYDSDVREFSELKSQNTLLTQENLEINQKPKYEDEFKEIFRNPDVENKHSSDADLSDDSRKTYEKESITSEEKVRDRKRTEDKKNFSEDIENAKFISKTAGNKDVKGKKLRKSSENNIISNVSEKEIIDYNIETKKAKTRKSGENKAVFCTVDGRILDKHALPIRESDAEIIPRKKSSPRPYSVSVDKSKTNKRKESKDQNVNNVPRNSPASRLSKSPEPAEISRRLRKLSKQRKTSAENIEETKEQKDSDSRSCSFQSLSVASTTSSVPGYMRPRRDSKSYKRHTPERDLQEVEDLLLNSYQYTRCTKRVVKPPVKYDYTYVINRNEGAAGSKDSYSIYFGPRDMAPLIKNSVPETTYGDTYIKHARDDSLSSSRKTSVDTVESSLKHFNIENDEVQITEKKMDTITENNRLSSSTEKIKDEDKYLDIKLQYENKIKAIDLKHGSPRDDSQPYLRKESDSKYYEDIQKDFENKETFSDIRQQYEDTVRSIAEDSLRRSSFTSENKLKDLNKTDMEDTSVLKYKELASKDYKDYGIENKQQSTFYTVTDLRNLNKKDTSETSLAYNKENLHELKTETQTKFLEDDQRSNVSRDFKVVNKDENIVLHESKEIEKKYDSSAVSKSHETYSKEYISSGGDFQVVDKTNTMKNIKFLPDYDYNKVYASKTLKQASDSQQVSSSVEQYSNSKTNLNKTMKTDGSTYVTFDGRTVTTSGQNEYNQGHSPSTFNKMADDKLGKVAQSDLSSSRCVQQDDSFQQEKMYRKCSSSSVALDSKNTSSASIQTLDRDAPTSDASTRSFLDDRSKVTGITDVLSRMGASQAVDHESKITSDDQARSLLNKFLGAQVLMTGVESMMANSSSAQASSHMSMTRGSDGNVSVTRNMSGGQFTKSVKDGDVVESKKTFSTGPQTINYNISSSSSPKAEGEGADIVKGVNINEVTDDFALNQLLDSCEEYDERRRVRLRLKALMAEKKALQKQLSGHERGDIYSSSRKTTGVSGSKGSELQTSEGSSSFNVNRGSSQVSTQKSSFSSSFSTKSSRDSKNVSSAFDKFKQFDSPDPNQSSKGPPIGQGPLFQLTTSLSRSASGVKDMILTWCQCRTRDYKGVNIENFSTSWNDGMAFCALIHHFYPDAFNFDALNPKNRRHNFALAFRVADERAGIMPLLDVDDMVMMKKPDWKCVFTYVQSLYKRLKDE